MTLRTLDWRFLLPDATGAGFDRIVVVGGGDEIAEQIVSAGVARRVGRSLSAPRSADCIAILAGASIDLSAAERCLQSGGALYIEVDRLGGLLRHTPEDLHGKLRALGLNVHATYGVLPHFKCVQLRFPLECRHALAWYFRTLFVADSRLRRLVLPWLHAFARAPRRLQASLLPRYAVVASAASHGAASVMGHPDVPADLAGSARPLVLTRGERDGTRVALFPFAPDQREPRAVLKFSRLRDRNVHTHNEQRTLQRLRSALPADLVDSVPDPLGVVAWGGLAVGMEGCVPGRVLTATTSPAAGRSKAIENLQLAAAWLTRLHREVPAGRVHCTLQRLEAYERAFALTPSERRLFDAAGRRFEELRDRSLPRVWQHWGYGEWNLYREGSRIKVIDWEGGEPGLPLYDLLHLVTTWYMTACGGRISTAEATQAIFVHQTSADRLVAAARTEIARYMQALELEAPFLPLLLTTYWVSRAVGDDSFERARARRSNPYIQNVSVLAQAADVLFL